MNLTEEMKTLEAERKKGSFQARELTYLIDGGKKKTEIKENVYQMLERDPIFNQGLKKYDMSRVEASELGMKGVIRVRDYSLQLANDPEFLDAFKQVVTMCDRGLAMRFAVHYALFYDVIRIQGTPEQLTQYESDLINLRVIGCFGMTELGHSSFLRGLETTATYDPQTQEFVIHSPTLTSAKIWIGMAGMTATHAAVFAKLILNSVDYGIHIFIVPLRDPETGQCLPGVSCGDLGPKMGRKQNDNGWILFSHVRIPRTNMLMRWAQVTEKGEYLAPSFPQISYATLINERVMLTAESLSVTSLGVVVAVRYSAIRRQGEKDNQILYYQSQQYRVIPILANWFGYHFGIRAITNQLKALWKTMDSNPDQSLNMFPDLHAISSCMKAYATWWTMQSLELCRQCLGGHGYSEYSAIPSLLGDFGVLTTGGGDNVVLAQQTARYLVGCYKRAHLGKKIVGSADYLNDFQSLLKQRVSVFSEADWDNPTTILTVWKLLAVHSIHHAALRLQQETEKLGTDKSAAWNECMMDLVSLAFIHNYYFLFLHFSQALSTITDPALNRVMHRLCIVMGLSRLEEKWGSLLEFGLLNPEHGKLLRNQIRKYINELTPDAVTIVDGFNYPDFIVNSPFGRYDGDIYTHYMKALKETPFTQGPPSYFNSLIKPLVSKL